jgi:hypothetical protein
VKLRPASQTLNTENAAAFLSDRFGEAAPRRSGHPDRRIWSENDASLPWFLPGSIRIRGGAAQEFSSDWLFHRGIQLESTLVGWDEVRT